MKNLLVQFVFILTVLFATFSTASAQYAYNTSYNTNTTYNFGKFETEFAVVMASVAYAGYDLLDYDILDLRQGESMVYNMKCKIGETYIVGTYTEDKVKDVIVEVVDSKGRRVKTYISKDKSINFSSVSFSSYKNQTVYVRIKNAKSKKKKRKRSVGVMLIAQ